MSSNTFLIDAATRHQVFVQRFAGGQVNEAKKQMNRLSRTISARITKDPTAFQAERLSVMLADVTSIQARFYEEFNAGTTQMALDFAPDEAGFTTNMLNEVSSVPFQLPSTGQLTQGVLRSGMDTPIGPGDLTMTEALDKFSQNKSREVINAINDGVLLGDTTVDISRNVSTLINVKQANQADTLIRTIVNHTSSMARDQTYKDNGALLEGYEWVATLDSATTLICSGRDGRVYPVGKGPLPPAHWSCRSTTIPVVKEEFTVAKRLVGDRPSVGADGAEVVSGKSTYGGWLKKQPADFQREVFRGLPGDPDGTVHQKLFARGGLTIDRFRDETGVTYSLDQLRNLEPVAFQRAGLADSVL